MKRGLGAALIVATALGLSFVTGPVSAVVPVDGSTSVVQPAQRDFLPHCATPQAMNCIESIEYAVDGEWQTGTLLAHDGPDTPQTYTYETPGLIHEGGRTAVNAALVERDDINGPPYAAYQFQLQSWPQDEVLWDPPINRCVEGDPSKPTGEDPCWRAPWLADTSYRFTFRTSTLVPIFVQSSVVDMSTTIAEMSGGLRVSLEGKPGGSQWVLDYDVAERDDRFDAVTYEWGGFFSDARAKGGSLAECQGLGIATAYSNGNGGQMPEWDGRTGTLSFGTGGFHYGPDGKVYRGRAEIFVPGDLARCMWKVDPRQTTRMEIEVFGDDGGEVAGTKSIGYDAKADLVKLIAIDFTYSQKQIAARPTPVKAKPGKKVCNAAKTLCVTVARSRKTAKVSVAKVKGASEVLAVALRGTREDGKPVNASVKKGKATFTVKLSGAKSKGQVWVVRTSSTYLGSFQVG